MQIHIAKSPFRNGNSQLGPLGLLPVLIVLQHQFRPVSSETHTLLYHALIGSLPLLLSHRFDQNWLVQTVFSSVFFAFLNQFYYFEFSFAINFLVINNFGLWLLRAIAPVYKQCFTFGEFAIIVQLVLYYFLRILQFSCYLLKISSKANVLSFNEKSLVILICFSSLFFVLLFSKLLNSQLWKSLFYLFFLPLGLYSSLYFVLSQDPTKWLVFFVLENQTRAKLFLFWFIILFLTGVFVYIHTYWSNDSTTTTVTRKLFHFSISLVYIFGLQYDVQFLQFASELLLFLFIYIELLRLNEVYMISSIIKQIFNRFRDEKDSGILTLTHIYLLIGCSAPLWLSGDLIVRESKLLLASGIVTVGIGDSFASLGGFYFGRHKWRNSEKSYEGTVCSIVTQSITLILLRQYLTPAHYPLVNITFEESVKFIIISVINSLVETFTVHVDNLLLPFVQYILLLVALHNNI